MNIGNLFLTLLADGARLGPSIQSEAQKAGDAGGKTLGRAMADRLRANAKQIFAGVGAAIGTFVAGSAQEFARFDDAMREVFSIMPGISKTAMDKMRKDVLDVSREYGILTDELVPALATAIGSGIPEENVMDFLRVAAKAAKAGATDAETSVKALSATINAFQIPVKDAGKVADSFFNAIDKGVTTFPELAASMSEIAPVAAAMGISLEEVLAAVTAMTLQGEPTSGAITKVTASLTALQRTTPEMETALKNLGFATGQAAIDALGYQGTMEALRAEADRLGVPLIKLTGRLEGTGAILQLTGQNAAKAQEILGTFDNTAGKVDAAFDMMEGGIGGWTRRTTAALKAWAIEVGGELQSIGPLFVLFGPTAGRAIGAGLGAAFGFIAPAITKLGAKIVQRLGFALLSGKIADSVAAAIGAGLEGPAMRAAVQGAGGRMGLLFGGAFVAAAAAAVAAVALIALDQQKQIDEQADQLLKQTNDYIKIATDQDLANSIAGVQEQLAQIPGNAYDSKNKVIAVLNTLIEEQNRRMAQGGVTAVDAFASGVESSSGQVALAFGAALGSAASAPEQAKKLGELTMKAFYRGVIEKQGIVQQALAAATQLSETTMTKAQEISYLTGVLTSKELAHGVHDKRDNVRAAFEETQRLAEERLAKLILGGGKAGKLAMDELKKALRDKDPQVRAAAERTQNLVEKELNKVNTVPAGKKAGQGVIIGLNSKSGAIGVAAFNLGSQIVRKLLAGVTFGGGLVFTGVPTATGHQHGGPERPGVPRIVGERRPELFVPEVAGYTYPSIGEGLEALGMGGGDTIINVPVQGIMPVRSPRDIVTELIRVRDVGILPQSRVSPMYRRPAGT